MHRFLIASILLITFALGAKAQMLNIKFSTLPEPNAEYEDEYVLAVWVEDNAGTFISSLMVYGKKYRGNLKKWGASSLNSSVNAVTGATILAEKTHNHTWNCKKADGQLIPKGKYKLCIELSGSDSPGPYSEVPFEIGRKNFKTNPQNGINFRNLIISYSTKTISPK